MILTSDLISRIGIESGQVAQSKGLSTAIHARRDMILPVQAISLLIIGDYHHEIQMLLMSAMLQVAGLWPFTLTNLNKLPPNLDPVLRGKGQLTITFCKP